MKQNSIKLRHSKCGFSGTYPSERISPRTHFTIYYANGLKPILKFNYFAYDSVSLSCKPDKVGARGITLQVKNCLCLQIINSLFL